MFYHGREKSVLLWAGKECFIISGKKVFIVGGKRGFIIVNVGGKRMLYCGRENSFLFWAGKDCFLLWAGKCKDMFQNSKISVLLQPLKQNVQRSAHSGRMTVRF